MKRNDPSQKKRKRPQKTLPIQLILVIVVIAAAALFFFWHQSNFRKSTVDSFLQQTKDEEISVPVSPSENAPSAVPTQSSSEKTTKESSPSQGSLASTSGTELNTITEQPAPPESVHSSTQNGNGSATGASANGGNPSAGSEALEKNDQTANQTPLSLTCSKSARTIKEFYGHLDQQPYVKAYGISPDSETYFTTLIQRLLDNPPVVSGETDDLYTILHNTAHFFRIIGKDNILLLKAILDMEKDRFEDVLHDFYTLMQIPSCSENSFGLHAPQDSLYNYAGFFLNTMGGRLYLFRRDSKSRMVVSYYSILLIDKANKNASNKHGIELRTAIDQLIGEMESTAITLQLKDMYLDRLYDLKEEYQ